MVGLEHALDFRLGHIVLLVLGLVFLLQVHHATQHQFQLLRIFLCFLTVCVVRFIYARIYISDHGFNERSITLIGLTLCTNIVLYYEHFSKIISSPALLLIVVFLLNPVVTLLGPKLLVVPRLLIQDRLYTAILVLKSYELRVVIINLIRKVVKLLCNVSLVLLCLAINQHCCLLLSSDEEVHFILQLSHFSI